MRKWLLLFTLLLGGCGLLIRPEPTPSPTPRPTETPIPEVRYYPPVDPQVRDLLIRTFEEYKKIPAYQEFEGSKSLVVWPLISVGKLETIPVLDKQAEVDVIWVIDYNHIKMPVQFPYAYGIWIEGNYYLFQNSAKSQPIQTNRDEVQEQILEILPRGIPFLVRVGTFVERGRVIWDECNYPQPLCDFGSFYDEQIDFGVTRLFISRSEQRVPNWWFLYGWLYDNLGTSIRLNLP